MKNELSVDIKSLTRSETLNTFRNQSLSKNISFVLNLTESLTRSETLS